MIKRIFISKPEQEVGELRTFCERHAIELLSESFLTFNALNFSIKNDFEVIFFGSKKGVEFFLKQNQIASNILIACVGESTARYLKTQGYTPVFVGQNSGEVEQLSITFKEWLGTRKVLFPQSRESNGTFTSHITAPQKQEIAVYETLIAGKDIPTSDCYIFSSPSNVKGYCMRNVIPKNAVTIAWGSTTERFMATKEIASNFTLKSGLMHELIQILQSQIIT